MKVMIPVEVDLTALADGRYNAVITVPVNGHHMRRQPLLPFSVKKDGTPAIRGQGAGHNVICDLVQAAVYRSGNVPETGEWTPAREAEARVAVTPTGSSWLRKLLRDALDEIVRLRGSKSDPPA